MTQQHGFVGTGFAFPMRVTDGGSIALVSESDKIVSSLRMILSTAPGERVLRPEFGCGVWSYLFDVIDSNTLGEMVRAVRVAIGRWEPRVVLEDVEANPDQERPELVNINIDFTIKNTNDRRNLVFPFYVIPREGEG